MVNRELGLQIVAIAENEPDRYDQSVWTSIGAFPEDFKVKETETTVINCGTKACLAGHASFIAAPAGTKFYVNYLKLPNGTVHDYEPYGAKALGLSDEHCILFNACTPLAAIHDYFNASNDNDRQRVIDNLEEGGYDADENDS